MRPARRFDSLDGQSSNDTLAGPALSPEEQFTITETRQILESMIDALPEKYRVVQVMRDVEGMSVHEAAECLGISQENVKVRLHRARALLRKRLYELFGSKVSDVFRFHLLRCDAIASSVSKRIQLAVIVDFARVLELAV